MMSEEKNSLASSVAQVRREICELQTQLAEAQEQEKLLVAYPDLNGPVNTDLTGRYGCFKQANQHGPHR